MMMMMMMMMMMLMLILMMRLMLRKNEIASQNFGHDAKAQRFGRNPA